MTTVQMASLQPANRTELGPYRLIVLLCSVVGDTPSGGDRLAVEIARHWPAGQPRPVVLTSADGKHQLDRLGIGGVDVRTFDAGTRTMSSRAVAWSARLLKTPRAARRLVGETIRLRQRPLVLSSSPFPPDLTAALAAKAAGAVWIQSWQLALPPPWQRGIHHRARSAMSFLAQQLCLSFARRWCQTLVVPIDLLAADAQRRGFRLEQIHVAPLAVDHEEIARGVATLDPLDQSYDAIFVGRFHAQKGLDDLLSAWELVQQEVPDATLAVVGDGEGTEAAKFKARLDQFDSRKVHRFGTIVGPQKYATMARSKVFLLPSHHEARPHAVIEAMAIGLPVIGYDLPWSHEAFGDAIVRVPFGDVRALATKIIELLGSEQQRGAYRIRGQRLAESLDWTSIAQRFFEKTSASGTRHALAG
jgi:glycosyltransferase involved in cell wall biosynthesis